MPALSERIRGAIESVHRTIEHTSLAQAMLEGTVSKQVYRRLLSQLRIIHESLESALDTRAEFSFIDRGSLNRAAALERDLNRFPTHESLVIVEATQALARSISVWSRESPACLIGCLYVLEGSRMGSRILAPRLAKAFGLSLRPGNGLDYHLEDNRRSAELWRQFKTRLDSATLSPAEQALVIQGAYDTMSGLLKLFQTVGDTRRDHVVESVLTPLMHLPGERHYGS